MRGREPRIITTVVSLHLEGPAEVTSTIVAVVGMGVDRVETKTRSAICEWEWEWSLCCCWRCFPLPR